MRADQVEVVVGRKKVGQQVQLQRLVRLARPTKPQLILRRGGLRSRGEWTWAREGAFGEGVLVGMWIGHFGEERDELSILFTPSPHHLISSGLPLLSGEARRTRSLRLKHPQTEQ